MTTRQIEYEPVNYFEHPLDEHSLTRLLASAGLAPHEAMRTNEAAYREHVANRKLSKKEMIRLMVKYPELIQRPIVVRGSKAVLARPADKLAELDL